VSAFTGTIHPVADLFPMLADDELAELASSIKADGLLQPIIVDPDGVLLDGRNRLAACKLAKVTPVFETYAGDADAYALTVNIARRHLTKGQRAMIAARACIETIQTVRGVAAVADVSSARVGHARTVLRYAPDLADSVVAGTTPLDAAYKEAQSRKAASEQTEETMDRLQSDAPDLADLVVEERMTLAEAHGAADRRKREHAESIERHVGYMRRFVGEVVGFRLMVKSDIFDECMAELNHDEANEITQLRKVIK
jgi:ParB-like chromosome segregation protein Spo0J